jgi:hypothetical protein
MILGRSVVAASAIDLLLVAGRAVCSTWCSTADPYSPDWFLGELLFRVARSNFAEAGG